MTGGSAETLLPPVTPPRLPPVPSPTPFSDVVMQQTAHWASYFASDWRQDTPIAIHSGEISADGSPQWHPDFVRWINRDEKPFRRNGTERLRTTKVMRRLRRASVREYEVLYRVLVLGERLEDTTKWLNERASRNAIPLPPGRIVHYTHKDTLALIVCGIDYARHFW